MLTDPSIEKLKEKSASPYDLTVLVSKRARELTDGAQPMIDADGAANVVSLACREVAADKVVAVKGDVEDEANLVADMIREKYGFNNIMINCIGATIGSHTGPGLIAIFFMGEER